MKKIEILPQFLFKFECSEKKLISDILYKLENQEWISNKFNFTSKDRRLEIHESYQILFEWIKDCIFEVKQELKLNCEELKITQAWANKSLVDQYHHAHVHPNSLISGIFYVTDSNAHTWFSMENLWSFGNYNQDYQIIRAYHENDISHKVVIHKEKSIAGNLIIFPSNLTHSVDAHHDANNNRYTISFNTFPCGMIGDYDCLKGLDVDFK